MNSTFSGRIFNFSWQHTWIVHKGKIFFLHSFGFNGESYAVDEISMSLGLGKLIGFDFLGVFLCSLFSIHFRLVSFLILVMIPFKKCVSLTQNMAIIFYSIFDYLATWDLFLWCDGCWISFWLGLDRIWQQAPWWSLLWEKCITFCWKREWCDDDTSTFRSCVQSFLIFSGFK